jgi:hypothetical protein
LAEFAKSNHIEMEPATDLDNLIRRGFGEDESKHALAATRGNVDDAVNILMSKRVDVSWTTESANDWKNNKTNARAKTAEARALWKSPYYISVPSWRRNYEGGTWQILYTVNVIVRDAKTWKLEKRYSEFNTFRSTIPSTISKKFENKFPSRLFFSVFSTPTDEEYENRRIGLEEWMRELCLCEEAMTNQIVLDSLAVFINSAEHDKPTDNEKITSVVDVSDWTVIPPVVLSSYNSKLHT